MLCSRAALAPAALIFILTAFLTAGSAQAQTCWAYTDAEIAKAPIQCVRQGDFSTPCSWNSACHLDGDPSDCCTTVPASSPQTVREMHLTWHGCFGATGRRDGNNPPGRSQRWYAFHRQFEIDFNEWRDPVPGLFPIESLDWCPNMILPIGHGGAGLDLGDHPASCGIGPGRPSDQTCPNCQALPQCLFLSGAGPIACPTAPGSLCGTPDRPGSPGFTLPHTSLEDFQNVEEVSAVLDGHFHGVMHSAIVTPAGVNGDSLGSTCSPRDPMFWRLHKALDDVVRAWQDSKAVDVVLVVDTSGSMSDGDATGVSKLEAAVNAADIFADLLEEARPDGQQNRVGIVTYASTVQTPLPMTPVTPTLRATGGAFDLALSTILSGGPAGCTGIGAGIERALQLLCPPGDCRGFSAAGDNDRKAIVLLTDGLENLQPCLSPAGPSGGSTCGNQCFGSPLDYARLDDTQVVSVGFGSSGSLNGPVLTLVSEQQGGVYLQNPNGPGDDLKQYYVKAFGTVSGEGIAIDPKGVLSTGAPATQAVEYTSCDDGTITFSSGWDKAIAAGDLRLLVTAPNGDLVMGGDPQVEASNERLWSNARVRLPYRGVQSGMWRAELVRPHQVIVNGFGPEAFESRENGSALVRREIQRLCPDGCKRVLFYENPAVDDSVYRLALKADGEAGLVGEVEETADDDQFRALLEEADWDLVVYVQTGADERARPYDSRLAERLCRGQRAIVADARPRASASIYRCAGARYAGEASWRLVDAERLHAPQPLVVRDPGDPAQSWSVAALSPDKTLATGLGNPDGPAVVAKTRDGAEQQWFIDVLSRGLSKLTPVTMKHSWTTADRILVAARILPSYIRAGGYDSVDARVEVEYPTVGLGTLLARRANQETRRFEGESVAGIAAALTDIDIPTQTVVIRLNDDGVDGDQIAGNAYWTGSLDGIPMVDGKYALRFIFDLSADGCTTRREANQTLFVSAGVDKDRTRIDVRPGEPLDDGRLRYDLDILPMDRSGNLIGPGKAGKLSCQPKELCELDQRAVKDRGDGSYRLSLVVPKGVAAVRLKGFESDLDIALPCERCAKLARVALSERQVREHGGLKLELELARPASEEVPATILLESSDPRLLPVPETFQIPSGERSAVVELNAEHLFDQQRKRVRVTARLGTSVIEDTVTVVPQPPLDTSDLTPRTHGVGDHSLPPIDYPAAEN